MAHGFKKSIDNVTVEAFFDGYPISVYVSALPREERGVRLTGIEQVRDLIYALQSLERAYERDPMSNVR